MGNTYSQIYIHLVFSTKERNPAIHSDIEEVLYNQIFFIGKKHGIKVLAVGGIEDHLHILLTIPPNMSVSKASQLIKGSSSKWLNDNFFQKEKFRWQRGYGAFSINKSLINTTTRYIENQREHHKAASYKDELKRFLAKHQISFDAKKL